MISYNKAARKNLNLNYLHKSLFRKTSGKNQFMRLKKIKNIPLKLRREFYKIPLFNTIQEQAYQKALESHAQFLPQLCSQGQSIVNALKKDGTCILPIDKLGLSSTSEMMNRAFSLANRLVLPAEFTKLEQPEIGSEKKDLKEFSEILLWALEPKLLDIIENYIGLPILYQGFAMRRSIADGQYSGVRRWHIDWEDRRTIKIIIYLNDVAEGGGPYEYISKNKTLKVIEALNYYNLGYVSDAEMRKVLPIEEWIACLAEKGSAIISDTSSVFHRAQPPTKKERFSITFCYTSTTPQVIWRNRESSRQEWEIIERSLNQRQKACLNRRRYSRENKQQEMEDN